MSRLGCVILLIGWSATPAIAADDPLVEACKTLILGVHNGSADDLDQHLVVTRQQRQVTLANKDDAANSLVCLFVSETDATPELRGLVSNGQPADDLAGANKHIWDHFHPAAQ